MADLDDGEDWYSRFRRSSAFQWMLGAIIGIWLLINLYQHDYEFGGLNLFLSVEAALFAPVMLRHLRQQSYRDRKILKAVLDNTQAIRDILMEKRNEPESSSRIHPAG